MPPRESLQAVCLPPTVRRFYFDFAQRLAVVFLARTWALWQNSLLEVLIGRLFPEPVAKNFPGRIFRQLVHEFNSAGVFVWRDAVFDEVLQFLGKLGSCSDVSAKYNERFGRMKLSVLPIRHDSRLQNAIVLDQRTLDFRGRHPLA